jgi:hypothetical protein
MWNKTAWKTDAFYGKPADRFHRAAVKTYGPRADYV